MSDARSVPGVGKGMQGNLARNGEIMDGGVMCAISNAIFSCIGRRGKILYSKTAPVGSPFASGITYKGRLPFKSQSLFDLNIHSSGVFCSYIYADSGVAGSAGFSTFLVNGVSQTIPDPSNTATAASGPSDLKIASFEIDAGPVAGWSFPWALSWSVDANSGIRSVIIYDGVVENSVNNAGIAATTPFYAGAPATYPTVEDLQNYCFDLHQYCSTTHFTWSGSTSVGTSTWTNILDAATTGYSSNAAGFWAIPLYQNTLAGSTVAAKLVVDASSTGTTGRVRISNSSGVMATITGIAGTGLYSADVSLDPTLYGDLLIVEASEATAAKTVTVNGVALYNLTA